jgi:hypothetical protein
MNVLQCTELMRYFVIAFKLDLIMRQQKMEEKQERLQSDTGVRTDVQNPK